MSERRVDLVVGLLLSLVLLGLQLEFQRHAGPLWRDEVNSVNVAVRPSFGEALADRHLDSFPVAWVALLYGWSHAVGASDAALRSLGALVGVATLAGLWWTGWRLTRGAPLVALLLFGMSASEIVYGTSVRGYGLAALAIVLATGAVWSFVARPGVGTFVVAELTALLAVHTYLPNAFLLLALCAGAAAVCLWRGTWALVGAVVALGAMAALSLLTNLGWVEYAFEVGVFEQRTPSLGAILRVFGESLAPESPLLAGLWAAGAALAVAGMLLAWRARPAPDAGDRELALFTAVATAVALVVYVAQLTYLVRLPTQYWYYLSLMALLALACDVGVRLLARRWPRGAWLRLAVVALAIPFVARDTAAAVRVRMTNLDVVARTLEEAAAPDDLIVVLPWYCGITFARYYRGTTPWITLPDFDEHRFHLHLLLGEKMARGDAGIEPELARAEQTLRAGRRVWVAGALQAPPPGEQPPSVAPAPSGPTGWRAGPYLQAWELRFGALLRTHGGEAKLVQLPDLGPVNAWENLPLIMIEGWH